MRSTSTPSPITGNAHHQYVLGVQYIEVEVAVLEEKGLPSGVYPKRIRSVQTARLPGEEVTQSAARREESGLIPLEPQPVRAPLLPYPNTGRNKRTRRPPPLAAHTRYHHRRRWGARFRPGLSFHFAVISALARLSTLRVESREPTWARACASCALQSPSWLSTPPLPTRFQPQSRSWHPRCS